MVLSYVFRCVRYEESSFMVKQTVNYLVKQMVKQNVTIPMGCVVNDFILSPRATRPM